MSVPTSFFTDPDLPQAPLSIPGLTLADQAAMARKEDPQNTLAEYQVQRDQEAAKIDTYELQRIQQENAQMRAELGNTANQLQEVRSGYDNLAGQMTAWQQSQANQASQTSAYEQFALSQEEMDNASDVLPVFEKMLAKQAHEQQVAFDQRLAAEKQAWQAEVAAPIQQELQQTKQQVASQAQRAQTDFSAKMESDLAGLGLGTIDQVMAMPEFGRRFSQAAAPGVTEAWGDVLKRNIENQNQTAVKQMMQDFRDNHTSLRQRTDNEVPASHTPQRPLTSQQSQNLAKREQLAEIYAGRQADANMGVFPPGWDRVKYRSEQQKLKEQIDAIPLT